MNANPVHFNETFGGLVLLVGVASTLIAFGPLRDRLPRLTALALLVLSVGGLLASHWLFVAAPGDRLDQLLRIPFGVLTLIGSLVCLVWGIRKLRAGVPTASADAWREAHPVVPVPSRQRVPRWVWLAAWVAGLAGMAVTLLGPFTSGVWYAKHGHCRIPDDAGCTGVLVAFGVAIGLVAGLLVYVACSRVIRSLRDRRR